MGWIEKIVDFPGGANWQMGAPELSLTMECDLPRQEFVRVRDVFGVGSGAQFVQVHALALSFNRDAERIEAVQEAVQSIRNGQNETKQCGHANQLSEPLAGDGTNHRFGERVQADI